TGPPRTGGDPLTDLGWLSRSPFDTGCGGPQEVVRHELAVLRPLRDCEPRPRQRARRRAVLPISRLDLRAFATGVRRRALPPRAAAVRVTPCGVRTSIAPGANVPTVRRVSRGASVLNEDLSNEKIATSMKDAGRLNASAVALSTFVGAPHEHGSLVNLGKLVDE